MSKRGNPYRTGRVWIATLLLVLVSSTGSVRAEPVLLDPAPEPSAESRAERRQRLGREWVESSELGIPAYVPLVRSTIEESGQDRSPLGGPVTPPPVVEWDGVTQTGPFEPIPPDPQIAVGPGAGAVGRVVEVTNDSVQIFDKTGASVAGPTPLEVMFVPAAGSFVFDPKVLFDQHSGRFFIVVLEVNFTAGVCTSALVASRVRLAVSTDPTPSNFGPDWIFPVGAPAAPQDFPTAGGPVATWADYPGIGADDDSLFITTNQFDATCTFRGTNIRVLDKAALLAGAYAFLDLPLFPGHPLIGAGGRGIFTIQPAHVFGATVNGGFYLVARAGPTVYRLLHVTGDPAGPLTLTTALFLWMGGADLGDIGADQCAVAEPDLDVLGTRMQNAVYVNGSVWNALTANPDADVATEVVWHEIATNDYPTALPAVVQSGFIDGGVGAWTYLPSIGVNAAGDAAVGFVQSSPAVCSTIFGAVRLSTEAPGTLRPATSVHPSVGFYNSFLLDIPPNPDRWGDYSATVVDPDDECFWTVSEYSAAAAVDASIWGTHVAKLCTATEGACCLGPTVCANLTPDECTTAGGTFQDFGSVCPTQGVLPAMHGSVAVVHWADPAVNCFDIEALHAPQGGSSCCVAHPAPGCDDPSCESTVCGQDNFCCNVEWDPVCVQEAESLCGTLCGGGCHPTVKLDRWITPQRLGQQTHHTFGAGSESPCIAPSFLYPGSQQFCGTVELKGLALGGAHGSADTVIRRTGAVPSACAPPFPATPDATVPIELVELSLVSVQPIQEPGGTFWNVFVDKSFAPQPPGEMVVHKSDWNGGTFSATLPVRARFTFTRVGDPSQVRVLDYSQSIPPIQLNLSNHPYSTNVDPRHNMIDAECNVGFFPALLPATDYGDCNGNSQRDDCDILSGASLDGNGNNLPDECDPDTDGEGVIDDLDNCPTIANVGQQNGDQDAYGDACDGCPALAERIEGDPDGDKVRAVPNSPVLGPDNCPCVSNYTQLDTDGDGTGDACENAGRVPASLLVAKSGGQVLLDWNPSCNVTDSDYAVYVGTVAIPFTSHVPATCSTGGATAHALPIAGDSEYYLVVAKSGSAAEGSYGLATSGERPPSGSACAPQVIGGCP